MVFGRLNGEGNAKQKTKLQEKYRNKKKLRKVKTLFCFLQTEVLIRVFEKMQRSISALL